MVRYGFKHHSTSGVIMTVYDCGQEQVRRLLSEAKADYSGRVELFRTSRTDEVQFETEHDGTYTIWRKYEADE